MKRYLITGGAGFIGSHIVERLSEEKVFVRILDNFSSGKMENLKGLKDRVDLVKGDIRDLKTCLKATKGIDAVFHQAALRSVPKSLKVPEDYNDVNIQGTLNMLKSSVDNRVKNFVFASSSSIYGEAKVFPEKEDFPPMPISPYALSKLTGEYYCRMYSYHYKLSAVSLRYFNVFGPRQALDDEYAVVIPKFINCMLNGERPPIFGTGKQSRDFTFVGNVVDANLLGAAKVFKGEVFNVASGRDYSILDLVAILNKFLGKDIKAQLLPRRAGDVFRTLADINRSKRILGFKPKVDFIEGLRQTLEYFKEKYA